MRKSATTNRVEDASRLSASLRTLFDVGTLCGLADGQLLERFLRGRGHAEAEAAFTAMVDRHGPMVLGVCRAVLGDRHDAEDACQAVFLVLARRAGAIRRGDSVASWLYGAARRIAARARRDLARRRKLERRRLERTGSPEPVSAPPAESWPELYEELDRLPEPFRAAVVLCDLEGHSYEQAAGLLRCPVGTLQSRLARGRERLRHRLERRGIAPAVALVGSGATLAALSPPLTAAIAGAAVGIGAGRTIAAAAPAVVAAMAGAEVRRQVMTRLMVSLTTLLVAGLTATAAIGLAAGGRGDEPTKAQAPNLANKADTGPIHVRVVDLEGKGAPGIVVEVRGGDQPRSFTTDAHGRATIPREVIGDDMVLLLARSGRDALAWGLPGDTGRPRPSGRVDDPMVMTLIPLDHRIAGSVEDRAGNPIAGVEMRLNYLDHPINGDMVGPETRAATVASAVTDRAGRFVFMIPRGARFNLDAHHPRYMGGVGGGPDSRTIGPAVLEPAGGIIGRVTDAATGRPVAGAVLGAQLIEHHARTLGGWGDAVSDDQGRFLLGGLEPGVYNVLLTRVPGRADATARAVEGVRVRLGADTPADVTVIAGRPLRGVAVDRDTGEPVPRILVGCHGPAYPRSGAVVDAHKADDRGRFTFHVPPGQHYVYLMDGHIGNRLAHRTVIVPEQGEVEPVRLMRRLVPNRDMMTGMMKGAAPPEGARKVAGPPPGEPTEQAIAEEEVEAVVSRDEPAVGKARAKSEVDTKAIEPAEAKTQEKPKAPAEAPKLRTVTGRVRDPQGRPLAGIRVNAVPEMPGVGLVLQDLDIPMTDREGLFILPGVPRRPLQITLNRPGYQYQIEKLPADRDEAQWTFDLVPDAEAKDHLFPPRDEPIPPDLRDRLTFVDLDRRGTDYLSDGPGGNGNDLNRLPRGIHKLGDTYFRIGEKMIHVRGRERTDLPQSVKGIKVQARGRALHFLHSTQGGADSDDKLIAAYVVHYADGSMETISVAYARDITNWWHRDPGRKITRARAAWTGQNDMVAQHSRPGLMIRLFDMTWTNPHPDKVIATLDVLSTGKECDPFLVAVTVERP